MQPPPRALLLLLTLLLLQLPLLPFWVGREHDSARVLQILILSLASLGWLAALEGLARSISRETAVGAGALMLLGAAAILAAARPEIALREGLLSLSMCAGALALSREFRVLQQRGIESWVLPCLIAGAALYAGMELLLLVLGLALDRTLDYWRVFAGYANPRFFNHGQTVLIPLLAGMLGLPALRGLWRRLAWFALVSNACFLLLLMGRATVVALVVGLLVAAGSFGVQGRTFVKRLMIAVAGGGLMYLLIVKGLPAVLGMGELPAFREPGERGSVEARFYLWGIALRDVADHPWLGLGPMHYAHRYNGEAAHPHNIYLQVAAEFGLPFFALLAVLVIRWLWRLAAGLRHLFKTAHDPLAIGCYIAIVAALVDGAFSGNFVMPLPQMWIVLTIALLSSRLPATLADQRIDAGGRRRLASVAWGLLLLAQVYLLATSFPEFLNPPTRMEGALPLPDDAPKHNPRFWQDGWF